MDKNSIAPKNSNTNNTDLDYLKPVKTTDFLSTESTLEFELAKILQNPVVCKAYEKKSLEQKVSTITLISIDLISGMNKKLQPKINFLSGVETLQSAFERILQNKELCDAYDKETQEQKKAIIELLHANLSFKLR